HFIAFGADRYYTGPTMEPVTEHHVADRADIDLRSTLELVELINDEDTRVPEAIRGSADELAAAIDAIVDRLAAGGRLVYVGAGSAISAGALTVAVVCVPDSELGALVEHEIVAEVGPEVVAGSTRMKAGTAQKLVLNTISTVSMIRLGKTFGNLMVDVVASNAKLRGRTLRAVVLATGASDDDAGAALARADGNAKVAIVALLTGVDAAAARERLEEAG